MKLSKNEYAEAITAAIDRTEDIALLDLIYQLLKKSVQRKESTT